ncbi:MAG: YicC family protein [Alteromonadaceae bacterium]|nr:MAG: YicC family protein [Alteromonadaceae bacterium]
MPLSMTGFARQELKDTWGSLVCEIRSVNHRYLETNLRMPDTLRALEPVLRESIRKNMGRGKIEVNFHLKTEVAQTNEEVSLNEALASQIAALATQVQAKLDNPAPLNALDILSWPGVVQSSELDTDDIKSKAKALFQSALEQLIANRKREGDELGQLIEQRLVSIAEIAVKVRQLLPEILKQHQSKLKVKLDALKVEVDTERFQQEAIYIAQKADVAEELDRLDTHLIEVRRTLSQKGPTGRRLDFLMQELNREANTLSSKSLASDTTQLAVDLKVLIEQMREQIQNIE